MSASADHKVINDVERIHNEKVRLREKIERLKGEVQRAEIDLIELDKQQWACYQKVIPVQQKKNSHGTMKSDEDEKNNQDDSVSPPAGTVTVTRKLPPLPLTSSSVNKEQEDAHDSKRPAKRARVDDRVDGPTNVQFDSHSPQPIIKLPSMLYIPGFKNARQMYVSEGSIYIHCDGFLRELSLDKDNKQIFDQSVPPKCRTLVACDKKVALIEGYNQQKLLYNLAANTCEDLQLTEEKILDISGEFLLTAQTNESYTNLLNIETRQSVYTFSISADVGALGEGHFVTARGNAVQLWDFRTHKRVMTWKRHGTVMRAMCRRNRCAVQTSDSSVTIWDMRNPSRAMRIHERIREPYSFGDDLFLHVRPDNAVVDLYTDSCVYHFNKDITVSSIVGNTSLLVSVDDAGVVRTNRILV